MQMLIQQYMKIPVFIAVPKTLKATESTDLRIISLMNHTLKIPHQITHGKVQNKIYSEILEEHFGF